MWGFLKYKNWDLIKKFYLRNEINSNVTKISDWEFLILIWKFKNNKEKFVVKPQNAKHLTFCDFVFAII